MISKKYIHFSLWLLLLLNIRAQGIYPILSIPYSARSIALCGSGTTDSNYSISYNPSSINTKSYIIGFHTISLPLDVSYNRLEAIIPTNNKTLFFEIKNIDYGSFYDDLENSSFNAKETDIKLGIKKSFYDTFSGSATIEYIYSSISSYISQAFVTSLGIRAETLNSRNGFSVSIENNGVIFDYYNQSFERINNIYRVSGYHRLKYLPSQININFIHDSYKSSLASISIESTIKSIASVRFGIGSILLTNTQHFSNYNYSFGVGLKYSSYIIDFGIKNINEIGLLSGISIHYMIP